MLDGVMIAAVFVLPALLLIQLSRRPRSISPALYFVVGGFGVSWGAYSLVTRPGWLPLLFMVQGVCFLVFGNTVRRAEQLSKDSGGR